MDAINWLRQTNGTPAFADLLWSKPQNRQQAGKLAIIGGNTHGFSAPAQAYQLALEAGVGAASVLLPDSLHKTIGRHLEVAEFAPSNPSGSFARTSLANWLEWGQWGDGVLLAGDFGRNSETAIVTESFLNHYKGLAVITRDAVDFASSNPTNYWNRSQTTVVLSLSQLQKLTKGQVTVPVVYAMAPAQLVVWLQTFSQQVAATLVTYHHQSIYVAHHGEVSATNIGDSESWRLRLATYAAVWQIQNPAHPYKAVTTAAYEAFLSGKDK